MMEIDFTNCQEEFCNYSGSEKKKKIIYNNETYLLKFPDPIREKNKNISYINNVYSEYLGSKIFKLIGIDTQEVILGIYKENAKTKVVVACLDFTSKDKRLFETSTLANCITKVDRHIGTDIKDVYLFFGYLQETFGVDTTKLKASFWDVFVVDTLIGNVDRHLSNWGIIVSDNKASFAPIYDNGSSLNPLLSDEEMAELLKRKEEFKNEVYSIYPIYRLNDKKLTYKEFYNANIVELNEALKRIMPKINIEDINKLIDETLYMSKIRKEFLKKAISYRYENILKEAYQD